MKLHSLEVTNFRGISHQTVEFGDGITIVSGRNESGKSSLIDAFDFLLDAKAGSQKVDIKLAQPVSQDVGPEVEAIFTVGPHKLKYFKRWIKKPATELTFLSGPRSGQSETGDSAHNTATALWEDLDGVLWKALRLMQASAPKQEALGASTSLQRALGQESGSAIDDPSSAPLLEKVSREVDKYYTSTRKSYSKNVTNAEERFTVAKDRVAHATTELDKLESDVRELQDLTEEVERGSENLSRESARLSELEVGAQSAKDAQALLEISQRAVDSLTKDRDAKQAALTTRQGLVTALTEANEELAALTRARDEKQWALEPKNKDIEEAKATVEEAKKQKKLATEALASANLFVRQANAREEIERLSAILTSYDELTEEISTVTARLQPVEQDLVDGVTDLERRIEIAESTARAGAAHVSVESLQDATTVLINGEEQELGSEPLDSPILSTYSVELPGHLRVTVTPHSSTAEDVEGLEALREDLAEALASAGVKTSAELRTARTSYVSDLTSIERLKERRSDRLDGRSADELRDELSEKRSWIEAQGDAVEGDIDKLTEDERTASTAVDSAEAVLRSKEEDSAKLRSELSKLAGQLENQQSSQQRAEQNLTTAREQATDGEVETALAESEKVLENAERDVVAAETKLEESGGPEILADYENLSKHVAGLAERLAERRGEVTVKTAVLDSKQRVAMQDELDDAEKELDRAEREYRSLLARAHAAKRLEDVLIKHQTEARRKYVAPFKDSLERLGRSAYQDNTFEVTVDNNLAITHRRKNGKTVQFESLSTGAKEQLAILVRLAVASLVSTEDAVPVMFDDTLGYSDQRMLHRVVDLIGDTDTSGQVIIFTANDDRFAGISDAQRIKLS